MKLYLVRHGQTDWNIKKQAQGVADIELNATGIAQAEALRDRIAAEDLHFDVSSMPRRSAAPAKPPRSLRIIARILYTTTVSSNAATATLKGRLSTGTLSVLMTLIFVRTPIFTTSSPFRPSSPARNPSSTTSNLYTPPQKLQPPPIALPPQAPLLPLGTPTSRPLSSAQMSPTSSSSPTAPF